MHGTKKNTAGEDELCTNGEWDKHIRGAETQSTFIVVMMVLLVSV
jgi:hypothetical protein